MITRDEIQSELAQSFEHRQTTGPLRRLVLSIVDRAARRHYGETYPTRCVQTATVISLLLEQFGIESQVWGGAFSYPERLKVIATAGSGALASPAWGGFWGENHHAWVVTEFCELVDLSVSQSHADLRHGDDRPHQIPAIWWRDKYFPSPLRYRFQGRANLNDGLQQDVGEFAAVVGDEFSTLIAGGSIKALSFEPLLEDSSSIESLRIAAFPWIGIFDAFDRARIEPPQSFLDTPGNDLLAPRSSESV
jgi:hypothetical protein